MDIDIKIKGNVMMIPRQAHPTDAGYDLLSSESRDLGIGEVALIGCGISIAIPKGFVGLVCCRSGMATKGVDVVNSPGVIDSGYRGEVKVILRNGSQQVWSVKIGDKIAQLLVIPTHKLTFSIVEELPMADRGTAGFGSTG